MLIHLSYCSLTISHQKAIFQWSSTAGYSSINIVYFLQNADHVHLDIWPVRVRFEVSFVRSMKHRAVMSCTMNGLNWVIISSNNFFIITLFCILQFKFLPYQDKYKCQRNSNILILLKRGLANCNMDWEVHLQILQYPFQILSKLWRYIAQCFVSYISIVVVQSSVFCITYISIKGITVCAYFIM